MDPSRYGVRGRYQSPEPVPLPAPTAPIVSAHVSRWGEEPVGLSEASAPRMVEGSEREEDLILLVFAQELDPLTIDPRSFGVLRGDGRRVRPKRVFLAPADEGDENRSLSLIGNFGSAETPPVAVHVLGNLYAETGELLEGLDADISTPDVPDRPLVLERLAPSDSRCPGAEQVIRSYWSDMLQDVGLDDLAGIELYLADGRALAPIGFDDHADIADVSPCEAPCLRPVDDNVLDLCVDSTTAVTHVRFAAGVFTDPSGRATAAADLTLSP